MSDSNVNKYLKRIVVSNGPDAGKSFMVDIYDLLDSYGITLAGQVQAIKKLLRGGRADKELIQDLQEAIQSSERAIERLTLMTEMEEQK